MIKKSTLHKYKEQIHELNANNLMQILCLKTTNSEMLLNIWADMQDKLSEVSIPFFKTFIRRLEDKERNDLENRKCGFHNSSVTRKKFEELISRLKAFNDLPMVLSYVPRYIDEIADATFSQKI